MPTGNTRPVEPVNNSIPSPRAQLMTWAGPNSFMSKYPGGGRRPGAEPQKCVANIPAGSSLVRFSPDFPAIRNFRAGVGIDSATTTRAPCPASTSAAINPAGPAPITRASTRSALNARPVDTAETLDLAHSIGSTLGAAELAELSQRFTVTRRFANVAGRTGLDADGTTTIPTFKRVTFTVSWTDYHHRPHTRSYETYLGYRGLSDYFAATHTPNTP